MTESPSESATPPRRRSGSGRPAAADQERLVRRYLSALDAAKPGRGTRRTADAVGNRITKVDELLVSADPLHRLHLIQERIELHAEYVRLTNANLGELDTLERDFLRVVRSYGDRNGITYAAWRQVGVEAKVLEQAGIHRAAKSAPPGAARAADKAAATKDAADKDAADKAAADGDAADKAAADGEAGGTAGAETVATSDGAPEKADKAGAGVAEAEGESGPQNAVEKGLDENPADVTPAAPSARNGSARSPKAAASPTSEEVSLDELADLLAAAGPSTDPAPGQGSDQQSLCDGFETSSRTPDAASGDRPRRSPKGSTS